MNASETPAPGQPVPAAAPPAKKTTLPETTEGHPWVSSQEIKKESNPFTEKDWRMFVYAWSGLAVRLVLVAGAIFSVYQFLLAREETRVQRALDMVELWEKPEFQKAQRAVKKRIDDLNDKYAKILVAQPTMNDRAVILQRIGSEAMAEEGDAAQAEEFEEQFDQIVYFLNRISFCVEGGLCSREVIDAYFGDYAKSFWAYFSGHIDEQRSVEPTYAQPIEAYVLGSAKPEAAP
jgi:hypothetical protein